MNDKKLTGGQKTLIALGLGFFSGPVIPLGMGVWELGKLTAKGIDSVTSREARARRAIAGANRQAEAQQERAAKEWRKNQAANQKRYEIERAAEAERRRIEEANRPTPEQVRERRFSDMIARMNAELAMAGRMPMPEDEREALREMIQAKYQQEAQELIGL